LIILKVGLERGDWAHAPPPELWWGEGVLANLDYSLLPAELRPGVKKRMKGARPRVEAKRTRPNLEERLHNLEDKEKNENEDEDEDEGYYFSKDYFPLTTIFQF